ncbi:MAG: hypothetical protein V1729_03330 [Candidatus Woesearchaeota archaeon]
MRNTKTTIAVLLVLLAVPLVWALSTTTQVNFNVGTVVAYTLTLPDETLVNANSTGAPTTAIEFNSSTGTDANVDAKVVGGTVQSNGVPIFQFDNTGTVNLNLSVVLNSGTQSCINLTGATDFTGASTGTEIGTSAVTVVNNYGPAAAPQDWYMKADFAGCNAADTSQRTLTSNGVQS